MQEINFPLSPAPHRLGALEELVDYFNDTLLARAHWTEDNVFSARSTNLKIVGLHVEALAGPLRLQSEMRRLTARGGFSESVMRLASLRVHTRSGRRVASDTPLRLQASPDAVQTMDRLCRLLHMLNHLAMGREHEILWLHVSLGHVLSVAHHHGQYFEDLLSRCGVDAQQIGLLVPPLPRLHPDFLILAKSIANYRERGYQVAINAPDEWVAGEWDTLTGLNATWLRLRGHQVSEALATNNADRWILRGSTPGIPELLRRMGKTVWIESRDPVYLICP